MRIGVNHGSLSDRIMNDYGDTPLGMVCSAIEFTEVCRRRDYHQIVFSMKSSNPLVMIQAYRLLVAEMDKRGWDYPLHLGVTEVGSGEEGRVKSAVGIGSLLLEGLGDTIRVSLTEDPWEEVDPCRHLIQLAQYHETHSLMKESLRGIDHSSLSPNRRKVRTDPLLHRDGTVVLHIPSGDETSSHLSSSFATLQKGAKVESTPLADLLYCPHLASPHSLQPYLESGLPILTHTPNVKNTYLVEEIEFLSAEHREPPIVLVNHSSPQIWDRLLQIPCRFVLLDSVHLSLRQREEFFQWLIDHQLDIPTILIGSCQQTYPKAIMWVSAELGSLLQDGYGEGVLLHTPLSLEKNRSLSFNLLQACRMRASKTEFIACPGCGRTQFDLQRVEEEVRSQTSHLPGVKIAIMGCVVNGPGEMADADFGYVGSRRGKVDLYVEKSCVERGIEAEKATAKLIELIQSQGRWIDPPA